MFDYIKYTKEDGNKSGHDIVVYALSTCGFCKRGLAFLRDNHLEFQFVYVDLLPFDTKQKVKEALEKQFDKRVVFPYLVLDNNKVLVGFVQEEWEESLGIIKK